MAYTDYVPETGCDVDLPEVSSDECTPSLELSELTDLYYCDQKGKPFTDVTTPTEWANRLSDTVAVPPGATGITAPDLIRHLPIIGEYPAPTVTEKDISGGREKYPTRYTHTINFDVDDITKQNYQFAQFTQKTTRTVRAWAKTKAGKMLGGNKGIVARIHIDPVFAKGSETLIALTGKLLWWGTGVYAPDLTDSPI